MKHLKLFVVLNIICITLTRNYVNYDSNIKVTHEKYIVTNSNTRSGLYQKNDLNRKQEISLMTFL